MEFRQFSIFIGIAVLAGTMLVLSRLKKDGQKSKFKDGAVLVGIGIAVVLFIIGLFTS